MSKGEKKRMCIGLLIGFRLYVVRVLFFKPGGKKHKTDSDSDFQRKI